MADKTIEVDAFEDAASKCLKPMSESNNCMYVIAHLTSLPWDLFW